MKKIIYLFVIFIFSLICVSCNEEPPVTEDVYYKVIFIIDEDEKEIKVKENNKVTKPNDPEKECFEFIGWYLDNELYDFDIVVTKDIILEAKFSEIVPTAININSSIGNEKFFVGNIMQLSLSFTPASCYKSVIWTSSDESIATVDNTGKVTAIKPGIVRISVASIVDSNISNYIDINVYAKPTSITIEGASEVYLGYVINLVATVFPSEALQSVVWSSSDESIATVDQNGKVTTLKKGTVYLKATSTIDPTISADYQLKIIIMDEDGWLLPNMSGYKIIIMTDSQSLNELDPFLEGYSGADKEYKQRAWKEVEENFNCEIVVEAYPNTAPWGDSRIKWIIDNAAARTSKCDLAVVSSNWIKQFATYSAAVDVSDYYKLYGLKQMEPSLKQAGTFQTKLYVASTGISPTSTYVDLGLFYNLTWLESLGVKDPAQMFLDDEWTYSGFKAWVQETQAKLGEGQSVFGGHPYYYYYGMSNAAGVKINDAVNGRLYIDSPKSKAACDLIYELVQAGCCDKTVSWAESDGGFIAGTTLMTTGHLSYVNNDSIWKVNMFGDDTKFGYVPFPYPDNVNKEDTRIGQSSLDVLLYVAGKNYPAGVSVEEVYHAVNEMFLNTIKYQQADPDFDEEGIKRTALQSRIDNPASIDCILYYDASKVFYDPVHFIYDLPNGKDLRQAVIDIMYKGKDFDSTFEYSPEIIYK